MSLNSAKSWLRKNPQVRTIRIAASDLNGQPRGKRVPTRFADKVVDDGTRFPLSVLNLDIWGEDIDDSPLVFDTGDADGVLRPTERGFLPMPWLSAPTALLPIWMFHDDGRPFEGDPRHALRRVLERYRARGLTPVAAMELEFFLIDDSGKTLEVPISPRSGKRRKAAEVMSIRALDAFDQFFTDLYDACEAMDIPADTAISEAGLGQFEINLVHQDDALRAADDAWLFKMLVKGLARRHGFAASFMAKPYEDYPGSGLHVHFPCSTATGAIFSTMAARAVAMRCAMRWRAAWTRCMTACSSLPPTPTAMTVWCRETMRRQAFAGPMKTAQPPFAFHRVRRAPAGSSTAWRAAM